MKAKTYPSGSHEKSCLNSLNAKERFFNVSFLILFGLGDLFYEKKGDNIVSQFLSIYSKAPFGSSQQQTINMSHYAFRARINHNNFKADCQAIISILAVNTVCLSRKRDSAWLKLRNDHMYSSRFVSSYLSCKNVTIISYNHFTLCSEGKLEH